MSLPQRPSFATPPSFLFHHPSALVPNIPRRYRQYAGLALVIAVYLGGIGGWSCAVTNLERTTAPAPVPPASSHLPSPPPNTHASPVRARTFRKGLGICFRPFAPAQF